MKRLRLKLFLAMAGLAAAPISIAQGATGEPLDEVVVRATRAQLRELRNEAVRLEDRFYQRYNELNRTPDFDVHCYTDTRTGTLIKGRLCRAVYESKALADEGREAYQFRQYVLDQIRSEASGSMMRKEPSIPSGGPPAPAVMMIEARRPAFRQNMREVVARDEELVRLLHDRTEALKKYDEMRRQLYRRGAPGEAEEEVEEAK